MLAQEYMRNALLAGTFVALACGACGWFVVLRGQVFAGDALGHVAFPGALAAAAAGADERIGLFAATVAAGGAIAILGRGLLTAGGGRAAGAEPAGDVTIGVAFTAILALGVFFLTRVQLGSGGGGIVAAHTLFGSIFGLSGAEAGLAAGIGATVLAALAVLGRPLLFASVTPEIAGARGVPTRLLEIVFLALLGVVAAEASQAVGALLLLGLLAGPAAAAHRLAASAGTSLLIAAGLAVASVWAGLALAWALPSLPPSTAVVAVATAVYVLARVLR